MGIVLNESSVLTSVEDLIESNESLEKNKKQQEYVEYIIEHVNNVKTAYQIHFVPLLDKVGISDKFSDEEFKEAIRRAEANIEIHDASKYDDEEFDGYREKYYPTSKEKADPEFQTKVKERSEQAWISHYKHNWHHPMYWVDENTGDISDMNMEAIIEMICDWIAMSMKYGTDTIEWFETKATKERLAMSSWTIFYVKEILYNVINC